MHRHHLPPSFDPDTSDGPAGFRPLAEAAISEMARLVAEVRDRYAAGDYAAALSSLAGLEESRHLLFIHVGELWASEILPAETGDAATEDGHAGLYL